MEYVGMVVYQVVVFFLGVQCVSNFIWRIPCNCMQFCSRFSAGTDCDLTFFHAKPPQNKKITPKLVLNVIFVQFQLKTSSKKLKTPNKTDIVLVSDGFRRFVFFKEFWTFGFLDFWFPMFIDLLASSLIFSWASRLNFLGIQVHIFWGDLKPYRFWSVKVSLLFGASTS